jgi:hypothetical protein
MDSETQDIVLMTFSDFEALIESTEEFDPVYLIDGHDSAFLGITRDEPVRAVYSEVRIIENLCEDMSYEDAVEFFEFNIAEGYVGERTPVIVDESIDP